MSTRLVRPFLVAVALTIVGLTASPRAHAQPKVCGNQGALGNWNLASCLTLRDDGAAPDTQAGDGIYSAAVQLSDTALLEYKILPTGMWDGMTELHANGTCPADGGARRNDTQNIQIISPDTRRPTQFFYDSRPSPDGTFTPAPGNRSGGDSAMMESPGGGCPRWLAVGDFQNLYGNNGTAIALTSLRPGVWSGKLTASKALAPGWRWKVLEATGTTPREAGPSGWAYAPCEATFATVNAAVAVGDTVYFVFHAHSGRLQTVVSGAPLDGFVSDGGMGCEGPADMAGGRSDLAGGPTDAGAAAPDGDAGAALADGGAGRRPGIHCECQVGRGDVANGVSRRSLGDFSPILTLLALLFLFLKRQLRTAVGAAERGHPTPLGPFRRGEP